MLKWILTKIVGSKNQRELRRLKPVVDNIVSIEKKWQEQGIDRDFLLKKTHEWQKYLHRFLPLSLPPLRIVEEAGPEELQEMADKLNSRFAELKPDFAGLPHVEASAASIEEA